MELNALGLRLLSSPAFETRPAIHTHAIVLLAVRDLGFPDGARMPQVSLAAQALGLFPGPAHLGPHLRLQYLDQPEVAATPPGASGRAPAGSLTIASAPLSADDEFPKGFYLRRLGGTLWLRGYRADAEHRWDADDRFVYCSS